MARAEYRNADYIALARLYERNEQRLLSTLNDGQKEDLQKMQDLVDEMRNIAECGAFMRGFRLAVQIMAAFVEAQKTLAKSAEVKIPYAYAFGIWGAGYGNRFNQGVAGALPG